MIASNAEFLGLVHVYTGTGKGKTTAATGLAVRALAHSHAVCWASFMKRSEQYGTTELDMLKKLGAAVFSVTSGHPRFNPSVTAELLTHEIENALIALHTHCTKQACNLLVMDEILIAIRDGFVSEARVLEFIAQKPKNLELVLTGRGATDAIKQRADYVSELVAVKHPCEQGIASRCGIEY